MRHGVAEDDDEIDIEDDADNDGGELDEVELSESERYTALQYQQMLLNLCRHLESFVYLLSSKKL